MFLDPTGVLIPEGWFKVSAVQAAGSGPEGVEQIRLSDHVRGMPIASLLVVLCTYR